MPTDASAGLRADAPSFVPAAAELLSADDIDGARDRDEHDASVGVSDRDVHDASVGVSDRDEHGESVDVSDRDEHDASVDVSERDEHDASVEVSEGVSAGGSDGEALQHADADADVGEVQHADADSADDDADDDEPEDSDDEALQLARALSLSQADYVVVTTPRTRWTATRTRRAAIVLTAGTLDAQLADGTLDAQFAGGPPDSQLAGGPPDSQRADGPPDAQFADGPPDAQLADGPLEESDEWKARTAEALLGPAFPPGEEGAEILRALFEAMGCAVEDVCDAERALDGQGSQLSEVRFACEESLELALARGEARGDGSHAYLWQGHRVLLCRWTDVWDDE